VWAIAVYAALAAVLAVGVGGLLRHAAAAVAVLILWPYLLELTLSGIPHLRDIVVPLLPFRNAFAFVGGEKGVLMWWGPWVSLLYFTGFVAVIFLAAAYVTNRRDP
jgi:ABC-2 type transport system permease protein